VRWSFAAFSIVLVIVGTMLILGRDVFPWPLDRGTSAVYGWIFLGAAALASAVAGCATASRRNSSDGPLSTSDQLSATAGSGHANRRTT
jgi:hypothetical protein